MAYEACRDVMEALRAKYSGPLQVSEVLPSRQVWVTCDRQTGG